MRRERRFAGRRVRRRRRIAASLEALARDCAVELFPWQIEWAVAALDGGISRGDRS